jgi:hypothetical protein
MAILGWLVLFTVMTLVFPFAGARGGFFHAGTAFQPYWWAVAPIGLERMVQFIREQNLLNDLAYGVFRGALVGICVLMTAMILWLRVLQPGWQPEEELYMQVEQFLIDKGVTKNETVIVRNPPGYYLVSDRPAIVMPPSGPNTILELSQRYGAEYFILEPEGVLEQYQDLYDSYREYPEFDYLGEVDGAKIFALHPAR